MNTTRAQGRTRLIIFCAMVFGICAFLIIVAADDVLSLGSRTELSISGKIEALYQAGAGIDLGTIENLEAKAIDQVLSESELLILLYRWGDYHYEVRCSGLPRRVSVQIADVIRRFPSDSTQLQRLAYATSRILDYEDDFSVEWLEKLKLHGAPGSALNHAVIGFFGRGADARVAWSLYEREPLSILGTSHLAIHKEDRRKGNYCQLNESIPKNLEVSAFASWLFKNLDRPRNQELIPEIDFADLTPKAQQSALKGFETRSKFLRVCQLVGIASRNLDVELLGSLIAVSEQLSLQTTQIQKAQYAVMISAMKCLIDILAGGKTYESIQKQLDTTIALAASAPGFNFEYMAFLLQVIIDYDLSDRLDVLSGLKMLATHDWTVMKHFRCWELAIALKLRFTVVSFSML